MIYIYICKSLRVAWRPSPNTAIVYSTFEEWHCHGSVCKFADPPNSSREIDEPLDAGVPCFETMEGLAILKNRRDGD